MPKIQPITVVANPWHALDAEGRPAAAVPLVATREIIGGRLNLPESQRRGVYVYDFDDTPVELRPTTLGELAFYTRCLRDGSLLPGDPTTAERVGVPWKAPAYALALAKKRALDAWVEAHGELPEWLAAHDAAAPDDEPDAAAEPPRSDTYVPPPDAPTPGFLPARSEP